MRQQRLLKYSLHPASQTYLIGLAPDQAMRLIARLRSEARNAITGAPIPIEAPAATFPKEQLYRDSEGIHPWSIADTDAETPR